MQEGVGWANGEEGFADDEDGDVGDADVFLGAALVERWIRS